MTPASVLENWKDVGTVCLDLKNWEKPGLVWGVRGSMMEFSAPISCNAGILCVSSNRVDALCGCLRNLSIAPHKGIRVMSRVHNWSQLCSLGQLLILSLVAVNIKARHRDKTKRVFPPWPSLIETLSSFIG